MIRLGLIGGGRWGRNYIAAAEHAGNCEIVAAASSSELPVLNMFASREWRRMLDERIDAFIVAAPPAFREEMGVAVLKSGRPLMVEKPMALKLASAIRIAKAAERAHLPLLVNHQHLFSHAYEAIAYQVDSWNEGIVVTMGGGPGPVREYSALWDYGPHDVAMFLGLAPNRRAEVIGAKREKGLYRLQLVAGNRTGFVRVWNDGQEKVRRLTVIGNFERADRWIYDDLDPSGRLHHHGQAVELPYEPPLTRAVRAFADAVAGGGTSDWRFDPYFGVEVTRILAQAEALLEASNGSTK
jgi:predicted dehydrogenase